MKIFDHMLNNDDVIAVFEQELVLIYIKSKFYDLSNIYLVL